MVNIGELVQNVIDGQEDPLKALIVLKNLEKEVKEGLKVISPAAQDEAEKYEKTFQYHGHELTRTEGRRTFNFKKIPEWMKKSTELKEMEAMYKQAYASYEKGITPVSEDGEVIPLPEVTYSKSSISVKKSRD